MAAPARGSVSLSQRIAVALLGIVLALWLRGCTSGEIYSSMTFATIRHYNGVELWETGHNPLNASFQVIGFTERWGFYHVTGVEAGHRVDIFIAPHWLFLILLVPPGLWLGLATARQIKRRRRAREGRCVSCGYSLAGNTTDICPECGARLKSKPFTFQREGIEVSEGTVGVNGKELYILNVSTSITAANPIQAQIKRVNEAMRSWLRERQDDCGRLIISVDAERADEQKIASWVMRLISQNIPEAAILKKIDVELVLRDESGKPYNRMTLGTPA